MDFETDSPAMSEKGHKTAKLSYLKMLELLLNSGGVRTSEKLQIGLEPFFESRVKQFRELMQGQGRILNLSILQDANFAYQAEENLDLTKLYYEEIEGMIEAEYRGCLRIEGVSINRVSNQKFYDYNLDLSELGVLRYSKRES